MGLCKEGPAPDQSGFCSSLGPQWWRSWGGCPAPHALLPLSLDKGLPLLLDEFNRIQHKPPEGCWVPLAPWFCGENSRVAARGRPQAAVGSGELWTGCVLGRDPSWVPTGPCALGTPSSEGLAQCRVRHCP